MNFYTSNDVSKRRWEENIIMTLLRLTPLQNGCLITFKKFVHETEKNKKLVIRNFNSTWKKYDFSTLVLEPSENVNLFVSLLWLADFEVFNYIQYFIDVVRNKLQTVNIY